MCSRINSPHGRMNGDVDDLQSWMFDEYSWQSTTTLYNEGTDNCEKELSQ